VLLLAGAGAVCPAGFAANQQAGSPAAGFVGRWQEYWPGIDENATHVVSLEDGKLAIKGWSPLTRSYAISEVRLEGDTLKFREGTAAMVVEYEITVKGKDTLAVRAKGMSGWRNDIVWRRMAEADLKAGPQAAGFVGTWREYWPGIEENATHVVSLVDGKLAIRGWSPLTPSYRISDVKLEGDALKFREGTAAFVVEYEVRVKDKDSLAVRAKGRSGWRDDIVWRRIED
jgi:hypothetical protein